jgi:hypothetical protein
MSATESPDEIVARLRQEREPAPTRRHLPIAISGTRNREPTEEEMAGFWLLFDRLGGTELHHGACRGIDEGVARRAEKERPHLKIVPHPADWDSFGPSAGPIRNRAMMAASRALIAFPGNDGTQNCIRAAQRQDRPVHLITDEIDRQRLDIERDHL